MVKFSNETLAAVADLLKSVDGAHAIQLHHQSEYTPNGKLQHCDAGHVESEWVDQYVNGGYSGDEAAGTVTWKLGDYYLVAFYDM